MHRNKYKKQKKTQYISNRHINRNRAQIGTNIEIEPEEAYK